MSTMTHAFEADTGQILDIVINALYSNREIFLRELISNASDALDKRAYLATTDQALLAEEEGAITLIPDADKNTLTLRDNGIGLSEEDMKNQLGTIARSGTKQFLQQLSQSAESKEDASGTLSLIGQFGVGFYSAFMVADKVGVISRKADSDAAHTWSSDGKSGYEISPASRDVAGTDLVLHLKKEAKEFTDEARLDYLVKKYSDHIAYPVRYAPDGAEMRQLNAASALWTRDKSEITDAQYEAFYQQIGAGYDSPMLSLHNRTEGLVNYTSLLFIPSQRPFDLFNMERKSRLQLYINRVFITDECEDLIPAWLRFVRGVVDTPDLDLNVSREMLQQNPSVVKIKKALVRRVLGELKKQAENKPEDYTAFWENFGLVLKEGLYEDADNRDKILEICRFRSARSGALISLKTYLEQMAEGQDEIYYLSAESVEQAEASPHLEGFKARDIDVLLLTDPVDEFWLPLIPQFEEKNFTSASRGAVSLDKFDKTETEAETDKPDEADFKPVLSVLKSILGDQVKDVRLSGTLTDSPACLVADENGMDVQMERLMRAHDKNFTGTPRILEINATHALIKSLNETAKTNASDMMLEDAAQLVFDQARILEGKAPADAAAFAARMTRVLGRLFS